MKTQWDENGGKCGVCGDAWNGPREHEAGGRYATGTIARNYTEGHTITIKVQVTATHKGYFEFRICPHNNPSTRVKQSCLDKHILRQPGGNTRVVETGETPIYSMNYVLPIGVTCSQCMLQWKWNTGEYQIHVQFINVFYSGWVQFHV